MVWIVMEQHQLFRAAFHNYIHRFAPVAMSPAALFRRVFLGQILRIVNKNIRPCCQRAHVLIENRITGLVVGSINYHAFRTLNAIPKAALRMVQPFRLYSDVVVDPPAEAPAAAAADFALGLRLRAYRFDTYKTKVPGTARRIINIHLIVTPEYLKNMTQAHPDVLVYALRVDRGLSSAEVLDTVPGTRWAEERGLDDHQYIVPGGGGFGEIMNNAFV